MSASTTQPQPPATTATANKGSFGVGSAGEGTSSNIGSLVGGGGIVELDKRLQWFEARLFTVFRPFSGSTATMLSTKFAMDIRKVFEDDDVRRDVTSFCESDACRMLVAFTGTSGTGASVVRLTASLADPEMHKAAKILCFRKLVTTLKQITAISGGSGGGTNNATAAQQQQQSAQAAGGGGVSAASSTAAINKITHDNIHRLVSFIEVKPHMLSFVSRLIPDVVMPLSQATIGAGAVPPTSPLISSGGRGSIVEANNGNVVAGGVVVPTGNASAAAWGGAALRVVYPPPVKRSIELEFDGVAQAALVAGGVVEGRTQLPKISAQQVLDAQQQQHQQTAHSSTDASSISPSRSPALSGLSNGGGGGGGGTVNLRRQSTAVSFEPSAAYHSPDTSSHISSTNQQQLLVVEQMAGMWIHQLQAAVVDDSPHGRSEKRAMASGSAHRFLPIFPHSEVAFWRGRLQDLEYLALQCQSKTFQSALSLLEDNGSNYFEGLMHGQAMVEQNYQDARTVCRWLAPLTSYFDAISLRSSTHVELPMLVKERIFIQLFHLLYLLWAHCPSISYPSCSRLSCLISGIIESLIEHMAHYMTLDMYFLSDPVETRRRVRVVFDVAKNFKLAFLSFKDKASRTVHSPEIEQGRGEWLTSTQQLFARMDVFLERLNDVLDILDLRSLLDWLAEVSISSVEAESLRSTIQETSERFRNALITFSKDAFESITDSSAVFDDKMKHNLFATGKEVMERIGHEIMRDAEQAPFGIHLIQRVHTLQRVLQHPFMAPHHFLDKTLTTLWTRWSAEIRSVQVIHVQNDYTHFLAAHVPETAKAVVFSLAVFRRLYELQLVVKNLIDEPHVKQDTDELQEALLIYNATCQRVAAAFEHAYQTWVTSLSEVIVRLNSPLLGKQSLTRRFYASLDHHVTDALRDVGMVVSILSQPLVRDVFAHLTIPHEAFVILTLKDSLWRRFTTLRSNVDSFYALCKSMEGHEKNLVEYELGTAEEMMRRGLETLTWEHEDLIDKYNEEYATAVDRIQKLLECMRRPMSEVQEVMKKLRDEECNFLPLRNSRVGDRTAPLEDFKRRYEESILAKRRELLGQAVEKQRLVASTVLHDINTRKAVYHAPQIHLDSSAFRCLYTFSVRQFWTQLNTYAQTVLEGVQRQLDPTNHGVVDGIPLLEGRFVVSTYAPTLGFNSGSAARLAAAAATPVPALSSSSSLSRITYQAGDVVQLGISPDVKTDARMIVQRLIDDASRIIQQTVKQLMSFKRTTVTVALPSSPTVYMPDTIVIEVASPVESPTKSGSADAPSFSPTATFPAATVSTITAAGASASPPTTSSAFASSRNASPPPSANASGAFPSLVEDVVIHAWEESVLGSMTFSVETSVVALQRRVEASLAEAAGVTTTLTQPLYAFEPLWSPKTMASLRQKIRDGVKPVYGLSVDEIKNEIQRLRELAERIHVDIANFSPCQGWLRVDARGIKHSMTGQFQTLQTFLLDHLNDATQRQLSEMDEYTETCMHQLDHAGPLLDSKKQEDLKEFFNMLRLIKTRFETESSSFLPMIQALRVLSNYDHIPKQDVLWLTERVEALQPRWDALFQRAALVRGQLSSVQDAEVASMRRNAVLLQDRLKHHYDQLRASSLFSPESLDTDEEGRLYVPATFRSEGDAGGGDDDEGGSAFNDASSPLQTSSMSSNVVPYSSTASSSSSAPQSPLSAEDSIIANFQKPEYTIPNLETRDIYELLDVAMKVSEQHSLAINQFHELQELFEVTTTASFSEVENTKSQLVLLKQVWDVTIGISYQVGLWMDTPFMDVDPLMLVEECRRFAGTYGSMPAVVRSWKVYTMAEKRVSNLMESLPLIQDLRSPALRARHWRDLSVTALGSSAGAEDIVVEPPAVLNQTEAPVSLMRWAPSPLHGDAGESGGSAAAAQPAEGGEGGPIFTPPAAAIALDPTNRSFTLGTLLRLNIHDHVDYVRKLVERAEKELVIERNLTQISTYWHNARVPFGSAPEGVLQAQSVFRSRLRQKQQQQLRQSEAGEEEEGKIVLGAVDDMVEALDEHLNILQNILNSRWAEVFRRTASMWQRDLHYVEAVLSLWVDVQRSLLSLFPIFARSEDLRQTLQQEVRYFDVAAELFFHVCDLLYEVSSPQSQTGGCQGKGPTAAAAVQALCQTSVSMASASFNELLEAAAAASEGQSNALGGADRNGDSESTATTTSLGGVLAALERVQTVLSLCEKRLGTFLEQKRRRFPRFYFISDVDLIDILSKEQHPPSVCTHIHQIMSAVERVDFDPQQPDSVITTLHSLDGEVLHLPVGVSCAGRPVENWLDDLLVTAQVAVREAISQANIAYVETARPHWMFAHIAQAILVVARSHWTAETTAALEQVENGSLAAMGDHASHLRAQLARTIEAILSPITSSERKSLISLITIDVHARDVVSDLMTKKVDSPLSFAWQSQLRFYFHNDFEDARREKAKQRSRRRSLAAGNSQQQQRRASSASPAAASGGSMLSSPPQQQHETIPGGGGALESPAFDLSASHAVHRCAIHICDTKFEHGLDFIGNCGCLVVTPLTDRCYITLTQALKLCKGGAPAGPAGTGKTETVKDIAHAMGMPVYVFNCSDQMDVLTVSNIYKGLAMSGAWGCFDEFNRISVEVLSVVSAQVKSLFDAKRRNTLTFHLLGEEIDLPFRSTVGVFITMNPGYQGRTELPENVKSLFRPCAMVVPDVANIAEILLCAEGFSESKELAKKFVRLYELSSDVLAPEAHYDWGLRAIRAVLLIAGSLKRQAPMHDERALLLKALRDANLAKLTTSDTHMYERLLTALFPYVDASMNRDVALETVIADAMAEQGFLPGTDRVVPRKVLQLYDLLMVRHSIFIMGASGTGKSSLIQIAKSAYEALGQSRIYTETFDPKSLSAVELYGFVHPYTREWRDGVLSRAFRDFASNHARYQNSLAQWIILDGSIDAEWIESMNSVMDDNKLLTLVNNERISMSPSMRLVFEITNLDHATPATVSRAGIMYLNRTDVGWIPMKDRWMVFQSPKARDILDPLFDKHFEKFLHFATINSTTIVPLNAVAHLRSVCNLLSGVLDREEFQDMGSITAPHNYERVFLWVCIWSFGLTLPSPQSSVADYRGIFSSFVKREFSSIKLPDTVSSVFDVDIRMNSHTREIEWIPWRSLWRLPTFAPASPLSNPEEVPDTKTTKKSVGSSSVGGRNGGGFSSNNNNNNKTDSPRMQSRSPIDSHLAVDLNEHQEDADRVAEEISLLLTGSKTRLCRDDVACLDPYNVSGAYTPLRCRYVPLKDVTSAQIKLLSILTQSEKHILLVGEGGTGKTALMRYFSSQVLPLLTPTSEIGGADLEHADSGGDAAHFATPPLSPQKNHHNNNHNKNDNNSSLAPFAAEHVYLHAGSDSPWLQAKMDKLLEKRSGRQFAPVNGKKVLLLLENMNLPMPDAFGSQSAHSLLRQYMEYGYWYDRQKLTARLVSNIQCVGIMNPSGGSQDVVDRLAHKFFTFGVYASSFVSMFTILNTLVSQVLCEESVSRQMLSVVQAALEGLPELLDQISKSFHAAVESFHYHFTIRDLLRMGQGLVCAITRSTPENLVPSLWVHEALSVFADRLVSPMDRERCKNIVCGRARGLFHNAVGLDNILGDKPLPLFVPFTYVQEHPDGSFDPLHPYGQVKDHEALMLLVQNRMRAVATTTNFVLFDNALDNVCRVSRVLSHPGAHALIIGVSGSGKRSLVRLAAEVTAFRVYQREPGGASSIGSTAVAAGANGSSSSSPLSASDAAAEVRVEFSRLVLACVIKNQRQCVLLTNVDMEHWGVRQFVDEYLESGFVDVFTPEERVDLLAKMATDLRSLGEIRYSDYSLCMQHLKRKLSINLRIVVSASPFLKTLKPLVRSCAGFTEMQIIYFHEWPQNALVKVAERIIFDPDRGLYASASSLRDPQSPPPAEEQGGGSGVRRRASVAADRTPDADAAAAAAAAVSPVGRALSPLPLSGGGGQHQQVSNNRMHSSVPRSGGSAFSPVDTADGSPLAAASPHPAVVLSPRELNVCIFLGSTHRMLLDTAELVRRVDHRDVYITPKTFITACQQSLRQLRGRREKLENKQTRLRAGLERLQQCRDRVSSLQIELGEYKKAVQQHAQVANQLLIKVKSERHIVEDQNSIALAEHRKTQKIVDEVNALVAECEGEIRAAQPIVDAARAALNTLNRPNLTELKSMNNPPEAVHAVTGCVMCILSHPSRIPVDRGWLASRRMMADVPKWMKTLEDLDVNNIPDPCIDAITKTVSQSWFNPQDIIRVSFAASSLCAWVVNVVRYHGIRVSLRPKESRLAEAQQRLASSQAQARRVQEKCNSLQVKLDDLVAQCTAAEAERDRLENLLQLTEAKLQRAQRLLVSLADEKVRWAEGVEIVEDERLFLDGDSLLGAVFSTYCGVLPAEYRDRLLMAWRRDLSVLDMPCSIDADPVRILFGEGEDVLWRSQGLAAASFMAQNAAVTLSAIRWPLLLDPQHEALRWLQGRAKSRKQLFSVLNATDPNIALSMVSCVSHGHFTVVELPSPYEVPPVLFALVEKRYHIRYVRQTASGVGGMPPRVGSGTFSSMHSESGEGVAAEIVLASNNSSMFNAAAQVPPPPWRSPSSLAATTTTTTTTIVDIGSDHEAVVHPDFFLVFRCVVANPTLQPDLFAQTAVVNFCVSEGALNEELLSVVVRLEKPELEKARLELNEQMNLMTVSLRDCENLLLEELSGATGDVLENERLITTLENTKRQSVELTASLQSANAAKVTLSEALQAYHPISTRACLMYMAIAELSKVSSVYHYSMDLFVAQYERTVAQYAAAMQAKKQAAAERIANHLAPSSSTVMATAAAAASASVAAVAAAASPSPHSARHRADAAILDMSQEERLKQLMAAITKDLFLFVDRSLFASHKLLFAMTVALTVLQRSGDVDPAHVIHFIRGSRKAFGDPPNHVSEWMHKSQWEQLNRLSELDGVAPPFRVLVEECTETTRWKAWCELPRPEGDRLPGDWKLCTPFQKLLIVKALRPDRLIAACEQFLQESFLSECLASDYEVPLVHLLKDLPRCNPLMFLLTPGVDPEARVMAAAKQSGVSEDRCVILSMGQNQEGRANAVMERALQEGGWVLLHNVHLMKHWLPVLDHRIQQLVVARDSVHPEFRLFLSCEPMPHVPSGLLQNAIKLVSEPSRGLRSNFLRAYQLFSHEPWEHSTKPHEFHVTVFSMCYFHAVIVERIKFGPVGWNRHYPFNTEDLLVCADVLATYLEDRPRVPWEDLRYMFGEIMYGGHITDQWDRRLCMTYLSHFVTADLLERTEVAPGVPLPTTRSYNDTKMSIEDMFPEESPTLYHLNPLSENRVRLREGRLLMSHLVDTVSTTRSSQTAIVSNYSSTLAAAAGAVAVDDDRIDDLSMLAGAVPELIALDEVNERLGEERTPFHHVFYQECERMNRLVSTMHKTLDAAEAAVRGTQAMSSEIDALLLDIACDRIPVRWAAHWGSTKRPLAAWLQLLAEASKQLNRWAMELMTPKLVNLTSLFVPIAFFGAVLQDASLRVNEALDHMGIIVEVTKRQPQQIDLHAREGCYVCGPALEGAAWDPLTQCLVDATIKDGQPLPVLIIRAASTSKIDRSDHYACPMYKTTDRAASYVTTLHLRSKVPSATWVLRGAAMILDAMY